MNDPLESSESRNGAATPPLPVLSGQIPPEESKLLARRALMVSLLWLAVPIVSAVVMTSLHVSRFSGVPGLYAFQLGTTVCCISWQVYAMRLAARARSFRIGRVAFFVSIAAIMIYTIFAVAGVATLYTSYRSLGH